MDRGNVNPAQHLWLQSMEEDLKKMGITRWWEKVFDREQRRHIVREAKDHSELWRLGRRSTTFALMIEGNHEKNPNQFVQHQDLNSELSEYESNVMNFDWCYALCIQKFITDHISQLAGAGI